MFPTHRLDNLSFGEDVGPPSLMPSIDVKTPEKRVNWIERASAATWVIVGVDHEEHEHCAKMFRTSQEHLLLTDLIGDYRRAAGLPCALLLTPLADKVIGQDRLVRLFATQVTHRFDNTPLLSMDEH